MNKQKINEKIPMTKLKTIYFSRWLAMLDMGGKIKFDFTNIFISFASESNRIGLCAAGKNKVDFSIIFVFENREK